MNFPKKQAQRLIPEYLLDYTEKLQTSHPDPTDSWGGSGGSYTSGDGIDITNNVISVDDTIAKKSDIPSLDGYATQTWVETQGYSKFSGSYNDLTDKPDLSIYAQSSNLSTVATSGSYNDLTDKPTFATVATSGSYNDLTDKPYIVPSSRIVTTDEKQTITGTKTFEGYITVKEITGAQRTSILPDAFDYTETSPVTLEKSRTKFNLPISKPKGTEESPTEYTFAMTDDIPDTTNFVTTNTDQTISGIKTFQGGPICSSLGGAYTMQPLGVGAFRCNDVNSTKQIDFSLPIEKSGTEYTIATKDDIHNPTITFTQGGTTKGTITLNQSGDQTIEFDAGSGGGGGGTPTNMVTTDTNQEITGEKTFVGPKRIKFKQSGQYDRIGFTGYDYEGTELGYLEMSKRDGDFTGSPISNMLGYWSNVNSAPNPSSDVMLGFKYFTKDSDGNRRDYKLVVPPRYNEVGVTRYIPISVNGNTADNTGNINVPTETLVFTLSDNSTVTVNVMTSATTSTTTTS